MELTIREVAALIGRSPRTVRAQVARGELPGIKRGGQWRIPRRALPLTDAQRTALQAKADTIRLAVEGALPSRLARTPGDRRRSVADLDAFRLGRSLLARLRQEGPATLPPEAHARTLADVEGALEALAEAVHLYDRQAKAAAVHRCRAALGRVVGRLLVASPEVPEPPVLDWLVALEAQVLPAVAGFACWTDSLTRRRP